MKLERLLVVGCFALLAFGCASRPATAPQAPASQATSTTTITSAPLSAARVGPAAWDDATEAPKAGKPQLSADPEAQPSEDDATPVFEEEEQPKEPRRQERRPGGGFSGYK
jgi:hypothetical protein